MGQSFPSLQGHNKRTSQEQTCCCKEYLLVQENLWRTGINSFYASFLLISIKGEDKLSEKIEKEYEVLIAENEAQEEGLVGVLALQKIKAEEVISVKKSYLGYEREIGR